MGRVKDQRRARARGATPTLGRHSREILAECGYAAAEIENLIASGAVAAA